MITSTRAKILLGIFFLIIGYLALSYAMFLGLQVNTTYGAIGIVGAALLICGLVYGYFYITEERKK